MFQPLVKFYFDGWVRGQHLDMAMKSVLCCNLHVNSFMLIHLQFGSMDMDGDKEITLGEFRTWFLRVLEFREVCFAAVMTANDVVTTVCLLPNLVAEVFSVVRRCGGDVPKFAASIHWSWTLATAMSTTFKFKQPQMDGLLQGKGLLLPATWQLRKSKST